MPTPHYIGHGVGARCSVNLLVAKPVSVHAECCGCVECSALKPQVMSVFLNLGAPFVVVSRLLDITPGHM
jgi:hypothetical protein